MFKVEIIGNLGADAEFHSENGNEFLTFKVAHNDRRQTSDGQQREDITWFSCSLNGRNENLFPHLRRGTCVFVRGDARLKQYHSEKQRRLVAGCDIFVREVQLVGGKVDNIPSRLYDGDGVEHQVNKYYHCPDAKTSQLYDRSGLAYTVTKDGWVTQPVGEDTNAPSASSEDVYNPAGAPAADETSNETTDAK